MSAVLPNHRVVPTSHVADVITTKDGRCSLLIFTLQNFMQICASETVSYLLLLLLLNISRVGSLLQLPFCHILNDFNTFTRFKSRFRKIYV